MNNKNLEQINAEISYDLVRLSHHSKTAHLGSNLSAASILTALYFDVMAVDPNDANMANRDRFFMSKGHGSAAHYMALAHRGFFPIDDVFKLSTNGSVFEEHSGIHAPAGVETVNGSLGHALGLAAGYALSAQLKKNTHHHFVLMGDGEINEGSVWEAAMFVPANGLNQVTAIVDHNKWQATGRSQEIMALKQISNQFKAFGWKTYDVDGHDLTELTQVLAECKNQQLPCAIVAHTVKGKGVSFMEDDNNWHYRVPTKQEVASAKQELFNHA